MGGANVPLFSFVPLAQLNKQIRARDCYAFIVSL